MEQAQGHAPQSIRDKHYLDIPIELLAKWHDGYVNWLLKEAGISLQVEEKNNQSNSMGIENK